MSQDDMRRTRLSEAESEEARAQAKLEARPAPRAAPPCMPLVSCPTRATPRFMLILCWPLLSACCLLPAV
jgi:hypothetical protein